MKSKPFVFKQFEVMQAEGVMKITTDSILFGAWVAEHTAKQVLDIGTGCGLLALMMAQKYLAAEVSAIDINPEALALAQTNFSNSFFKNRLNVYSSTLQSFEPNKQYDLIVTNPPYFIADLKAKIPHKLSAKHTVELSYEDLIKHIARLLTEAGKAYVVIPAFNLIYLEEIVEKKQFYITKKMNVIAVEGKLPYLVLLQLERKSYPMVQDDIIVKDLSGNYTKYFMEMTKDFYLKF